MILRVVRTVLLGAALSAQALAGDVLQTNGFTMCGDSGDIQVQAMNIQYNRVTQQVVFDVAGTSTKVQNVTAALVVQAYGRQVYQKSFNPCDSSSFVAQLCPGMFIPVA